MLYLYLDESGDLGFDFIDKQPSNFFCITILLVEGVKNNRKLLSAVKTTRRRKFNKKSSLTELKGSHTSISIKKYFFNKVKDIPFNIYSLTLNKRRVYENLREKPHVVYNFFAKEVLDRIPLTCNSTRIEFIIDKSKNKKEIARFNSYIIGHLKERIGSSIPLDIYHHESDANQGLQAVDLFCWGIFRKYEREDKEWYDIFTDKVKHDSVYLPQK